MHGQTMTEKHHTEEKGNVLSELFEGVSNIFLRLWLIKFGKWLYEKKSRMAWAIVILLFVVFVIPFWFIRVQPKINTMMSLGDKISLIESKQQKNDSLMLISINNGFNQINTKLGKMDSTNKVNFNYIDNRFDHVDRNFQRVIHYVAKNPKDERQLEEETKYKIIK